MSEAADRAALTRRWLWLTRDALPAMAVAQGWPICRDHCFMRVCLDAACGQPWHLAIRRPAIQHAAPQELARAIAVAEQILTLPERLVALNSLSLRWRRDLRWGDLRWSDLRPDYAARVPR